MVQKMRKDEDSRSTCVKLFVLNLSDCCYQPKGRRPLRIPYKCWYEGVTDVGDKDGDVNAIMQDRPKEVFRCSHKFSQNIVRSTQGMTVMDTVHRFGTVYSVSKTESGGKILTGENQSTRRRSCPSATLSTTNPILIGWRLNPRLLGENPETTRLSH